MNHEAITPDEVATTTAPVHYHGDPVTAFPGTSCDRCAPDFARDFIATTAAQKGHFMVPAAADYLACDRTINEERERLRREYERLPFLRLIERLRDNGRATEEMYSLSRDVLVSELVDTVCPREWLDRRLKEVL